jgi:hypothetical protein
MDRMIEVPSGRVGRKKLGVMGALGTLVFAVVAGVATVAAADPSATVPVLPGEPNVPWDDGAVAAEVRTDLVGVHPRMWDHVLLAPDGRTATVYFTMGPPECNGLAGIDVAPADPGFRILVLTGDVPGAEVCPEIVQLYRSVVVLDERVITGGELFDLPGGGILRAG